MVPDVRLSKRASRKAMNFFQFLKSLDDLLYEVVSWLLFYPLTLWRSMRRPIATMAYAEGELDNPIEDRFDALVSPPVQLLLTVLVAHGLELTLVGESELLTNNHGLAALVSDDVSLILFRVVAFAIFPLVLAAVTVRLRNQPVTRTTLMGPFFAQCYACAPFALSISVATTLTQVASHTTVDSLVAAGIILVAVIVFVAVQTAWFRRIAGVGAGQALVSAIVGWAAAAAAVIAIGAMI